MMKNTLGDSYDDGNENNNKDKIVLDTFFFLGGVSKIASIFDEGSS